MKKTIGICDHCGKIVEDYIFGLEPFQISYAESTDYNGRPNHKTLYSLKGLCEECREKFTSKLKDFVKKEFNSEIS